MRVKQSLNIMLVATLLSVIYSVGLAVESTAERHEQKPFMIKNITDRQKESDAADVAIHEGGTITAPPGGIAQLPMSLQGKAILWGQGSKHTLIGKIKLGEYLFESDKTDFLQFMVDKDGNYVYIKGKGTVTMPDRQVIKLPLVPH